MITNHTLWCRAFVVLALSFSPPISRAQGQPLGPFDGRPRVIACVYGGQGTMNVPSWSPDGMQIAFVSNTAGHAEN
jgi:hypothetical protein